MLCGASEDACAKSKTTLDRRRLHCLQLLPSGFSRAQRQHICGHGCLGTGPAECASGAQLSSHQPLSSAEVIEFCTSEGATFEKGVCFGAVQNRSLDRASLCLGASNDAPALCANDLRITSQYPESAVAKVCSRGGSHVEEVSCINAAVLAKINLTPEQVLNLCETSSDSALTHCAMDPALSDVSGELITQLCRGAQDGSPVECYLRAHSSGLEPLQRALLCSGSTSKAPAECIRLIPSVWKHKMSAEQLIHLCADSPEGEGPARCITQLPPTVDVQIAVQLCRNAKDAGPAACFQDIGAIIPDPILQEALCGGTERSDLGGIVDCLRECPHTLTVETKALVCRGTRDSAPGVCSSLVWDEIDCGRSTLLAPSECRLKGAVTVVELCAGTSDAGPGLCLRQSSELGIPWQQRAPLCKGATIEENRVGVHEEVPMFAPVECALLGLAEGLNPELVIELCRNSTGIGPIRCAAAAPEIIRYSRDHAALCKLAVDAAPSVCVDQILSLGVAALSTHHLAALCGGVSYQNASVDALSRTSAPGECFRLIRYLGDENAVSLCAATVDLTPAHCAMSLSRALMTSEHELCRSTPGIALGLRIESVGHDGELGGALYPGSKLNAELVVLDQFGRVRTWDNTSLVTAVATTLASSDNSRVVLGRNHSVEGFASFQNLTLPVEQAGNYSLRFTLHDSNAAKEVALLPTGDVVSRRDAVVKVRVGHRPEESSAEATACDAVSCYEEPHAG